MRFFNFYTKHLLTILALIGTINLFLTAQMRRGSAAKSKAEKPSETLSSETFPAMNEAWEKGELPAALPVPDGSADEAIALLATKITAKNGESVPALLTALQMSGFFVTGKDGRIVLAPAVRNLRATAVNAFRKKEKTSARNRPKRRSAAKASELRNYSESIPTSRIVFPVHTAKLISM